MSTSDIKTEPDPSKRNRAFTLLALSIPFLFFALLEISLRLSGYGNVEPLFIPVEATNDYRIQNPEVARRYFKQLQVLPTGPGDVFLTQKPDDAIRIFVQGGSSAAGYPYYYGGSFSRMLEQRLQLTFPDRSVEVINTAMAAVNSYTLLDFADEIIAEKPDAVLIYAGHNEFYGALGVGSAESFGGGFMVRSMMALSGVRIVHMLRNLLSGIAGIVLTDDGSTGSNRTLMERMAKDQSIALGSKAYEQGLSQFRTNLGALLRKYRSASIPVYVGTLASNERDQSPFISANSEDASWNADFQLFKDSIGTFSSEEAMLNVSDLINREDDSAEAFYIRGRLHGLLGQHELARLDFEKARDRDLLRFRAPTDFNEIIQSQASENGAFFVPVLQDLRQRSPDGIIGSEFMLEHLHPNIEGYYQLQESFYKALVERHFAPNIAFSRKEIAVTEVDSVFGSLRLIQLMDSWPFRTDGKPPTAIQRYRPETYVDSLAWAVHQGERSWAEAQSALRLYHERAGNHEGALRAARTLQMHLPYLPEANARLGLALSRSDRKEEAVRFFKATNRIEETTAVYLLLGNTYLDLGQNSEAEASFRRAYELDPDHEDAAIRLTAILAATRQVEAAMQVLKAHVAKHPEQRRAAYVLQQMTSMNGG
ncbi:MAG: tetratricopeptide repeat protein [Rhodothermales bacterium]|nr:tetratricopeptide repeat protein [Rhodothermales bacterium]MDG2016230.1 tetratricopeptide repeat protein [Rhodothermales bacterium]